MNNENDQGMRILEASERSGEASKIAAERQGQREKPRSDPEVPAKATRRRFTARYKLRILEQTDACETGEVGALLRREGIYYSNLQTWRRQREEGTLEALKPHKRGRKSKPVNPLEPEVRHLQVENRKLKRKLEKYEAMLDLQKKVSKLLGISLASSEENEDES
jgi:transposase-like protein